MKNGQKTLSGVGLTHVSPLLIRTIVAFTRNAVMNTSVIFLSFLAYARVGIHHMAISPGTAMKALTVVAISALLC